MPRVIRKVVEPLQTVAKPPDKPAVRVFTKAEPCTKLHIWNCFRGPHGFLPVPVVHAQSQIGANAPRNMLNNGYVTVRTIGGQEAYVLTETGDVWLTTKFAAYLRLHPDDAENVQYLPV